jgi:hypothetical protein
MWQVLYSQLGLYLGFYFSEKLPEARGIRQNISRSDDIFRGAFDKYQYR